MTQQHTPGPWHVGMKPGPMVYGKHGEPIADCREELYTANENGHNARLIAAAPDLLAALKDLEDRASVIIESDTDDGHPEDVALVAAWKRARAAIAKAEGEP